ncbi:hypothetical protein XENTR_v10013441 [Xenopus tropicalis]|nr:hypothetical protein XENTR_v10013441 [Xenopus tropicalis]
MSFFFFFVEDRSLSSTPPDVSLDRFVFHQELGRGSYGKVSTTSILTRRVRPIYCGAQGKYKYLQQNNLHSATIPLSHVW